MNQHTPIAKAVKIAGGQVALARLLAESTGRPYKQQHVFNWIQRGVPADVAIPIERATGGAVSRHELRPDLYPMEAP